MKATAAKCCKGASSEMKNHSKFRVMNRIESQFYKLKSLWIVDFSVGDFKVSPNRESAN